MSIWTKLFGGSETKSYGGVGERADAIGDYANSINPNNTGFAAKQAKKGLRALGEGNYDSDPTLSGYFAPIRDAYSTSVREGERDAGMGVGAKFGADNPVLAQRVQQLNEERARDAEGSAMSSMIPGLHASLSNTYQQGQQNKIAQQGIKLDALNSALKGWLSQFYQHQEGGIIPAISGLAQGAGSMMMGFGGLGGKKPGG